MTPRLALRPLVALTLLLQTLAPLPLFMSTSHADQLRYTSLERFDPHRKTFTCVHEADAVPPIDAEAETWNQQALAFTNPDLWPRQRNPEQAAALLMKAAAKKHWRAQMNLVAAYQRGIGVPADQHKAIELLEEAMRWGVPAAWDQMGVYWQNGLIAGGPNAAKAYAFFQKAADLGSPAAQTFIGEKLVAIVDDEKFGFWANEAIGFQMLECAFAQGHGQAAYELGKYYEEWLNWKTVVGNNAKSLQYQQDGLKFGSRESSAMLMYAFDMGPGTRSPAPVLDKERKKRYRVFSDMLFTNSRLRFPNLDKVLPLPPAELPYWDGDEDHLVDQAKPVVPKTTPPHPAAQDGRWREIAITAPLRQAPHHLPCPQSGIWMASVPNNHPAFMRQGHPTIRQAWVANGAPFPLLYPHRTPLVTPADITWYLLEKDAK